MKILVIGGTGHVGSEVVKELKKRHADVRVLVRKAGEKSLPGVEMVVVICSIQSPSKRR